MIQGTQNTDDSILGTAILGKTSYNRLNGKAWLTTVLLNIIG